MKDNKGNGIFRFIMISLFIIFATIYLSQATGYYDYQQHKRVELTAEKIKEFEEDIKQGKPIDIKDYLETEERQYNNGISQAGLKLSKTVEDYVKKGVNGTFKFLEKLLTD
jgi:hypothetical protein